MAWAKVDDRFPNHPRAVKAGPCGRDLYIAGLCYAKSHLTDGFIPEDAVATLAPGNPWRRSRDALVGSGCGLWERVPGGYRIHDYHEYNERAEEEKARLEAGRKRKRDWIRGRRSGRRAVDASTFVSTDGRVDASVDALSTRSRAGAPARVPTPTPTPVTPLPPTDDRSTSKPRVNPNGERFLNGTRIGWPGRPDGERCQHGCLPGDEGHICVPD